MIEVTQNPGGFPMTAIRLPLSGDVTQVFNINVGESSNPDIEKAAICKASYGMQLGRIGDALIVLLRYVQLPPEDQLRPEERHALRDLKRMLDDIADVKEKHNAKHVVRP
jgi:hypothetical protein